MAVDRAALIFRYLEATVVKKRREASGAGPYQFVLASSEALELALVVLSLGSVKLLREDSCGFKSEAQGEADKQEAPKNATNESEAEKAHSSQAAASSSEVELNVDRARLSAANFLLALASDCPPKVHALLAARLPALVALDLALAPERRCGVGLTRLLTALLARSPRLAAALPEADLLSYADAVKPWRASSDSVSASASASVSEGDPLSLGRTRAGPDVRTGASALAVLALFDALLTASPFPSPALQASTMRALKVCMPSADSLVGSKASLDLAATLPHALEALSLAHFGSVFNAQVMVRFRSFGCGFGFDLLRFFKTRTHALFEV